MQANEIVLILTRLGVIEYKDGISRRIVFANVVFVSLPLVYLIFMLIDYEAYQIPLRELRFDQWVVPIIIGICFFCLWLNHLGRTTISRILFIGLWPVLLHIIPIKLLQAPLDYYLAYPFGIVFHSILIQLIFSYREEWILFWSFMFFNLLAMVTSPLVLTYFDTDHDIPARMLEMKYYYFDGILYWLLFNLVTFYIIFIIESYIKSTNASRDLIEEQKEELNAINQNLEGLVSQRTEELEEQNEKLKQHAFFNAHLLRGPFCRIQGLVQLQELTDIDAVEKHEIKMKLNESITELDKRIREIQTLIERDKL